MCAHRMKNLHLIRASAAGFILFLLLVITLANRGEGDPWWSFIHHIPFGDKVGHIGLFGTLGFLCNLAFPSRRFGGNPFIVTKTTLVLLALITVEELSQIFIPSRSFDIIDWLADLVGLACGQTAALIISKTTTTRPTS